MFFTDKIKNTFKKYVLPKEMTIRSNDKANIRKEIGVKDRLDRKTAHIKSEISLINYKIQRNKASNMQRTFFSL